MRERERAPRRKRAAGAAADAPALFGALLRRHRLAAGLSQEALAERAGLSARGISDLERGRRRWPQRATVRLLVCALALDPERSAALAAAAARPRRPDRGRPAPVRAAAGGGSRGSGVGLPAPLTSFVGREHELDAVGRLLASKRLITLTGPGGMGKTRLALRAASDAQVAQADGVWLADLGSLADPALVPQVVAAAVGVREEPGQPLLTTLTDALRRKRLLLVLDNCEHLLDAAARCAAALLRACPGVRVLATSREALGLAGETVWTVPPLTVPPDGRRGGPGGTDDALDGGALARYAAVRLFADRAVSVRPEFALSPETATAVAQICARLDGIPLAIELAAARTRVLPPRQLLERLEDRFRLLTGGSRTALERHRTLRATVDWSYDLLDERERRVFARLSVFVGGWTLEAAEAVAAGGGIAPADVLDALSRLVETSLVTFAEQPDGAARYRLLETLRLYGRQELAASGEEAAVRERHAAHVLAHAEAQSRRTQGASTLAARDFGWFARETDNVRAALDWLRDRGDAERGLRLGAFLDVEWLALGQLSEGRARLSALLALPAAQAPTRRRARALVALARLARHQGDYAEARARFAESGAVARSAGDREQEIWALYYLAELDVRLGDFEAGRRGVAALRAAAAVLGDAGWHADAEHLLGLIALHGGAYAAARAHLEVPLAAWRAEGTGTNTALVLRALGRAALGQGDRAAARAYFAECLTAAREHGRPAMAAGALHGFAALAAAEGDAARAARLAGAAEALYEAGEACLDPSEVALMERELAPARRALGPVRYAAARAAGRTSPPDGAVRVALAAASGARRAAAPLPEGAGVARGPGRLTAREADVLGLVAGGLTSREIAEGLALRPKTVERHVANIYAKIGARNRAEAVAYALRHGIGGGSAAAGERRRSG
jgi:non-specific serine/threonine protein kinase